MKLNDGLLTGFILRIRNSRENDRIISFYSRECGKIEILVRAGRKIKSKLTPIISEPFALLVLKVAEGRENHHLIGGQAKESFKNILKDYKKITRVKSLFLTVDTLLKVRKPDQKILLLIIKFLRKINQSAVEGKDQVVGDAFLIKFLTFLGYRPEIKRCLICQKEPVSGEIFFNLSRGGIICPADLTYNREEGGVNGDNYGNENIRINDKVLSVMQKLLYKDFDFLAEQNFVRKDLFIAEAVIDKFCQWHVS